jgi:hypothetical protein
MIRKLIFLIVCVALSTYTRAQNKWPKEIAIKSGGKVVIYQPQPEDLTGNKLTGRSAVSVKETSKSEPVFGAIFYEATLNTNKDTRMADMESLKITNAKFSGVEDQAKVDKLSRLIETESMKWNLEISIDELVATIKKENISSGSENFNNAAPKVLYRNKPSTLVILDGEPKIQKDKDLDADRVVNSPSLIFKEDKQWNMYTGGVWYKSASVTSGWSQNTKLSKKVNDINTQIKKQEAENNKGDSIGKPIVTEIIISTEPAELLQTKGEADYKTIQGTSLVYISNTTNHIFKDINTQKTYVLLAGRWYSGSSLNGPWEYVASDKLPADFAKIPEGSDKDEVLANVAGTDAADEAKIDAIIPQTAKVDRKTATVKVEYDGEPKFKSIDGTSLQLAENSNVTVMKDASGKYFALENGVWFNGDSPKGPWAVANERPKDVENIPASSEAYNTKYVSVYESTPDYVYVGYTPGYMGCYVYGPTVVYGTGFYYNPWYGSVYYPRPVTWGFGFHYNPWTGWSMSVGVSVGFMHVGIGFGAYGAYGGCWFGPPFYRPPYYRPAYYGGHGGYYGGHNNININTGNNININNGRNNIYNNKQGISTKDVKRNNNVGNKVGNNNNAGNKIGANNKPNAMPSKGSNNVFADKNGNVMQKDNKGAWNQRDNNSKSWKPAASSNYGSMNQQSQMRDRSANRSSNFQSQNRSMGGGGGRSSSGARRR